MYLQVQYEGLQTAYMEDAATNTLIKKFLALPMLPAEHIPPVFESLSDEAVTEPMEKLAAYINWEGPSEMPDVYFLLFVAYIYHQSSILFISF